MVEDYVGALVVVESDLLEKIREVSQKDSVYQNWWNMWKQVSFRNIG